MVMGRNAEKTIEIKDTLITLTKLITSKLKHVITFCKRSSKVTYFKISFSYEIQTHNNGSILFDKTWEEGER